MPAASAPPLPPGLGGLEDEEDYVIIDRTPSASSQASRCSTNCFVVYLSISSWTSPPPPSAHIRKVQWQLNMKLLSCYRPHRTP